ncbi:MAG TPA: copper ion binding protein, partial [Isosphaeraceae bacterium]|nr:copper ion binding protein [Isosphaeraceae bacterium]
MSTETPMRTIPVSGMTCGHCVKTVTQALEAVPGVREARVDLEGERAEVDFEPGSEVGVEPLRQAVREAGYEVPQLDGEAPIAPARLVTIGGGRPVQAKSPVNVVSIGELKPSEEPATLATVGEVTGETDSASEESSEGEEWELAVGGMHCASCVARVEKALG